MNRPTVVLRALLVCVASAVATLAGELEIPDTLAGKRASALIAALNTGDEAALRKFEIEHRAESAARRRPLQERVTRWRNHYADWGELKVRNVLSSGEYDILIVVETERAERWVHLALELEEEPPHGIVRIRIEGPVSPKSSKASNKLLDNDRRKRLVERIADELLSGYIFEDVAKAMTEDIRGRLAKGDYDAVEYSYPFAQRLTDDLRAVSHDKHLRVIPRIPMTRRGEQMDRPGDRAPKPEDNYGFVKTEILPDNVGYIKFNQFEGSPDARPTAAAAMAFVANTDALIFDVTENGGGDGNMITFLCGYLFDKPVHLNTFESRGAGIVIDTYSDEEVPGKHYGQDKPVYVLTSAYTFSAAEEFTYDLKHLKRATIVGETTGGGAHPVRFLTLNKYFILKVPHGRAVNPITKTNWEGVGVIPHVEVPADKAKETAYQLALQAIKVNSAANTMD
ncbi:MAG: S41 family peptidase [Phycisphaerales bacterium]|nr:MAG: S41 family peptidase [Phycisphaerales bacterium]